MVYERCARCCTELRQQKQKCRPIPLDEKGNRTLPPNAQRYRDDREQHLTPAQKEQLGETLHACLPANCYVIVEKEIEQLNQGRHTQVRGGRAAPRHLSEAPAGLGRGSVVRPSISRLCNSSYNKRSKLPHC